MTVDAARDANAKPAARTIMPPYLVLRNFLSEETAAGLLDFALAHEEDFAPSGLGPVEETAVNPSIRRSLGTRDLGPFRPILSTKVLEHLPDLVAKLGTTSVQSPTLELQLVAHNDGAFYKRHIDTQTATERYSIRVLSCVYYFYAQPKAFAGGALRLYALGDPDQETFVDIEPAHNSLLVFPSWAPHEVMPVACPSKLFSNSRFAINCWVYRRKPKAASSNSANA